MWQVKQQAWKGVALLLVCLPPCVKGKQLATDAETQAEASARFGQRSAKAQACRVATRQNARVSRTVGLMLHRLGGCHAACEGICCSGKIISDLLVVVVALKALE